MSHPQPATASNFSPGFGPAGTFEGPGQVVRDRPELAALAGILLLGSVLRFATLGLQSYRYDEAVTAIRVIHSSLLTTISTIPNSESNPPVYYVTAWLWSRAFGVGEVGLRSFSALAGSVAIIVVYLAATRLVSKRVGLIAAAIVAVNPVLVWFSQDARSYSLVFLLASLSFLFFVRAWQAPDGLPGGRLLAAWAVASALALATHYFALFLVVPEAALLLIRVRERHRALIAVGCVAAVGALLLPLALHQVARGHAGWIAREPIGGRLERVGAKLVGDDNGNEHGARLPGPLPLGVPAGLAIAGVAFLAALAERRERKRAVPALIVAAGGVVLTLLAAALGLDYVVGRNMLPLFIPLIVVLAAGFGVHRAGPAGLAVAGAFCLANLAFALEIDRLPKLQREDAANAAKQIGPPRRARAVVTLRFTLSWPLRYYLPHTRFAAGRLPRLSEIDLVGSGIAGARADRLLPKAFKRVEFKQVSYNYTLTRFLATRPQRVPLGLLEHGRLVDGSPNATVLVEAG